MGFAGIQPFLTQPQPEAERPTLKHRSRGALVVQLGMGGWDGAAAWCWAGMAGSRASASPMGASAPPAAAHCSGETPGLEAAAQKKKTALPALAREQHHGRGCKSLHAAQLTNRGPLPKQHSLPAGAARGSVSPASLGSRQGWGRESQGMGRWSGTSQVLELPAAPEPGSAGSNVPGPTGTWCQQPPGSLATGFGTAQQPVSHAPVLATCIIPGREPCLNCT